MDIVVTDPQGRPVTGLSQDDFKVAEDGRSQPVRSFEAHALAHKVPFAPPRVPQLPANTYLNLRTAPDVGGLTVILYDALNTPLSEQSYAHHAILDFLKRNRPGMQIAIFFLSDRLHLLQGFTEDTSLLSAALAERRGNPQATWLFPPGGSDESPVSPQEQVGSALAGLAQPTAANNPAGVTGRGVDQTFQDVLEHFEITGDIERANLLDRRVEITLNALTEVGRFLSVLPGRKNVVWLSAAFPLVITQDTDPRIRDTWDRDYSEQIRKTTDLLTLGNIAVYPVDPRGIRTNSVFSAATNASFGGDPAKLNQARGYFIVGEAANRATADTIADNTGGHAFYGTNSLEQAVESAITSGSTYYSLSYSPTNPKYDGSLRHIKVTLKKSGYTLAYRKTYYADDLVAAALAAADAPVSPLSPALERGTPLTHGLFVEAHLDAAGPPAPATPAQMQVLSQYEAMRTQKQNARPQPVMMQNYYISYGLIARQLEMPEDDKGAHQASLEFGMISYDEDGRKLNGLDARVDDAIPPPRYAKLAADGYHAVQSIAVPVTAASLRLAVRDIHGNRTGSLEVKLPLAKTDTR